MARSAQQMGNNGGWRRCFRECRANPFMFFFLAPFFGVGILMPIYIGGIIVALVSYIPYYIAVYKACRGENGAPGGVGHQQDNLENEEGLRQPRQNLPASEQDVSPLSVAVNCTSDNAALPPDPPAYDKAMEQSSEAAPAALAGKPSNKLVDTLDTIARLNQLKNEGALTEQEFARRKGKLIDG